MNNQPIHEDVVRNVAKIMGASSACANALRRADEYKNEGYEVAFAIENGAVMVLASQRCKGEETK